ncbi:solute carrier family 23 member 2-like, partial [Ruditapes philippinarum]|uniref:solute carrier family 23 member 2-like n=1 Tax=Ruditapes philippinarum TaxID=129788 RepID=UPI00295BB1E4
LQIQGNLIVASITQVVLGCTGIIGILLRFVGPLTIAPTITLIGPMLIGVLIQLNSKHWGVAFLSMGLTLLFSGYLANFNPPIPGWSMDRHCHIVKFPIFQLFSVLLSIGVGWFFCYTLTVSDVFADNITDVNYVVRTDAKLDAVYNAPWLYWPYPFQFGIPTVSSVGYVGFLIVTLVSVLESVCDYHAAARMSGVPPPPPHAVNRGIAMEGFASIISGMVGAGHGTTSYSHNIGAIGITKVASRAVFLTAGIILLVSGVVGKFGAVLTIIPDPVVGGVLTVLCGMIMASGLSTLKFIALDSTRNLTVLGTSLIVALMMPEVFKDTEMAAKFKTGYSDLDQIVQLLFGTSMFLGGFIGCILDNTIPGTDKERGLLSWRAILKDNSENSNHSTEIYKYPYVTKFIKQVKCCSYIPISPTFDKEVRCSCCYPKVENDYFETDEKGEKLVRNVAAEDNVMEMDKKET